jgi:hypothetical protein
MTLLCEAADVREIEPEKSRHKALICGIRHAGVNRGAEGKAIF